MLQKVTSKRGPRAVPMTAKPLSSAASQAGANPAPVVVAVKEPHPVYGSSPIGRHGCTLEHQSIHTLNHWHRKASTLLGPWNAPGDISDEDDKKYQAIHAVEWDIYRAACKVELGTARSVAIFLEITERHHRDNGGDCDNIVISGEWLRKITSDLAAATEYPHPRKRIPAFAKGKKLTRAGLMLRYHAFLIGELRTLGWAFYGNDEYPQTMIPIDSAVQARTTNYYRNGKPIEDRRRRKNYPFFDESKLTDRARSVLKSLKIDITKAERN